MIFPFNLQGIMEEFPQEPIVKGEKKEVMEVDGPNSSGEEVSQKRKC